MSNSNPNLLGIAFSGSRLVASILLIVGMVFAGGVDFYFIQQYALAEMPAKLQMGLAILGTVFLTGIRVYMLAVSIEKTAGGRADMVRWATVMSVLIFIYTAFEADQVSSIMSKTMGKKNLYAALNMIFQFINVGILVLEFFLVKNYKAVRTANVSENEILLHPTMQRKTQEVLELTEKIAEWESDYNELREKHDALVKDRERLQRALKMQGLGSAAPAQGASAEKK